MNPYEILLMLDPELADERQSEIVTRMRELIERGGGSWVGHDVWGRRKLAYEIDKKADGAYHYCSFDAEPETLEEVARILRITDGVMRHLATKRIEGARVAVPPPVDAVPEPEYARNTRSHAREEEE